MEPKKIIYALMVFGLFVGGYVPAIWGGSVFSLSSIVFGAIGGVVGIWVGYKLTR